MWSQSTSCAAQVPVAIKHRGDGTLEKNDTVTTAAERSGPIVTLSTPAIFLSRPNGTAPASWAEERLDQDKVKSTSMAWFLQRNEERNIDTVAFVWACLLQIMEQPLSVQQKKEQLTHSCCFAAKNHRNYEWKKREQDGLTAGWRQQSILRYVYILGWDTIQQHWTATNVCWHNAWTTHNRLHES